MAAPPPVEVCSLEAAFEAVVIRPTRDRRVLVVKELRPRHASALLKLVDLNPGLQGPGEPAWQIRNRGAVVQVEEAVKVLNLLMSAVLPKLREEPTSHLLVRALYQYKEAMRNAGAAAGGSFAAGLRTLVYTYGLYYNAATAVPNQHTSLFAELRAVPHTHPPPPPQRIRPHRPPPLPPPSPPSGRRPIGISEEGERTAAAEVVVGTGGGERARAILRSYAFCSISTQEISCWSHAHQGSMNGQLCNRRFRLLRQIDEGSFTFVFLISPWSSSPPPTPRLPGTTTPTDHQPAAPTLVEADKENFKEQFDVQIHVHSLLILRSLVTPQL
uniref:Uncharacterized protein n=1 Tax=Setaria italica TaxID=4555 RepID=K3YMM1_SETIT